MKRYSTVLIALALLASCAPTCFGDDVGIPYKIHCWCQNGLGSGKGNTLTVVGVDGAGKGFDGENKWPSPPSPGLATLARRVNGTAGWNGETNWYNQDIRETVVSGQTVVVDDIYVWAAPGTQDLGIVLCFLSLVPPSADFTVSLVSVPQGVTYTGPTTWGSKPGDIRLPFYSTDDGTTGYRFRLNVFAVPEPSSLSLLALALASVGVGRLRRRR